jgi:hypothetical protein
MIIRSVGLVQASLLFLVTAAAARADDRNHWQHSVGYFERVKEDKWIEAWKTNRHDWVEKESTEAYIELYDASRKATVHLFADRCELKYENSDQVFTKIYDGSWRKEAVADSKPASTAKPDDRDYWRYKDGYFEKGKDEKWVEVTQDKTYEFAEKKRTDEHVELYDAKRKLSVYLYADHSSSLQAGSGKKATKLYDGQWGKEAVTSPASTATGKAEDRDYWRYADGHFEKLKDDNWIEVTKDDRKFEFKERKRTDEVVELYDSSRKTGVRLFADRCEIATPGPLKSISRSTYEGRWGKDSGDLKTPVAAARAVVRAKGTWVDNLAKMTFPEGEVAGMLAGQEFNPNQVEYSLSDRMLTLAWKCKENTSALPDLRIQIDLVGNSNPPVRVGKVPEGVTFKRNFMEFNKFNGVFVIASAREAPNQGDLGVLSIPDVAYIVEYTGKKGDKLVGKIYVCLGDAKKSFLAGSFEATLVK